MMNSRTTSNRVSNSSSAAAASSSSAAPLLNEYKRKFVLKRLLQTILGGLLLKFDYKVPFYVYLSQLVLYTLPFLFGGVGILIKDLVPSFDATLVSLVTAILFCMYINMVKLLFKIIINKNGGGKRTTNNLLAEEDLLEFDSHENCIRNCCTYDKLSYLVPNLLNVSINKSNKVLNVVLYIVKVLLDTLVAGFILFCSVYFLSITYLYQIYGLGGNIVMFILSWVVICNALYALLIREPFELAVYSSSTDSKYLFSFNYLSRAFYVCAFFLVEIIYNFAPQNASIPITAIFWIKLVFLSLPILWSFGTLPPIDAFLVYLLEQAYIHLYGGSATATLTRLFVQIVLAVVLSMVHFIPNDIAIVAILSAFGYVLSSVDFVHIISTIKKKLGKKTKSKVETISNDEFSRIASPIASDTTKSIPVDEIKEFVYHVVMLILTVACSMLIFNLFTSAALSTATAFQVQIALLYTCIGLYCVVEVCSSLQNVYIFFGLIRNPFYPKNCLNENYDTDFELTLNHKKKAFQVLKYTRLLLLRLVAPIVMCAVVTIDCYYNKVYNDSRYGYMRTLFVLRAYRWIWQSTQLCLFEMSFMSHLLLFVILYNSTSDSAMQASLIQNYLPACMAASFVYDRCKQFLHKLYTFLLITVTSYSLKGQRSKLAVVFIVLNFVLLVPYIIPLIILSSIFSAPLLPLFTFPAYFLGFPRTKRFWPSQSGPSTTTANPDAHFYHQLTPHLLESFKQCVLTGSAGSAIQADQFFLSRFQDRIIWIQVLEASSVYCVVSVKGLELQETSCHTREAQYIDDSFEETFESTNGSVLSPNKFDCIQSCDLLLLKTYSDAKNTLVGILDNPDSFKLICTFYPKVLHYFIVKYLIMTAKPVSKAVAASLAPSKPSDSIVFITQTENMKPKNRLSPIQQQQQQQWTSGLPDINQKKAMPRKLDSLPDWSDTDSLFDDLYENKKSEKAKVVAINKQVETKKSNDEFHASIFDIMGENSKKNVASLSTTNFEMKNFKVDDHPTVDSVLSLPTTWVSLLKSVDNSSSTTDDLRKSICSADWLNKIFEILDKSVRNQSTLVNEYQNLLTTSHLNFLLKCSNCLGLNGHGLNALNPQLIYKLYKGELPWSPTNEKITKEAKELHAILIKAFCYTVKLVIDSVTIVPCENDDELFDTLKTYETDWFIGFERDVEYVASIKKGKPYIFTLFDDSAKKTVNSRTLSIKNIAAPLARLNSEVIKSVWSSTNLELLYMTNDDDERYSIQAHQYILRNLTIQASDPPLGYPIYNSEPLYISTCF